jgi:hypothetical protein
VTAWVFDAFAGTSLRQIMLVHNVDNPASCRVAEKAGYPFRELSPANPPHWFTDGHIHMRLTGHGDEGADGGWSKALRVRCRGPSAAWGARDWRRVVEESLAMAVRMVLISRLRASWSRTAAGC